MHKLDSSKLAQPSLTAGPVNSCLPPPKPNALINIKSRKSAASRRGMSRLTLGLKIEILLLKFRHSKYHFFVVHAAQRLGLLFFFAYKI